MIGLAIIVIIMMYTSWSVYYRRDRSIDDSDWINPRSMARAPLTLRPSRMVSLDRGFDLPIIRWRCWLHGRTIVRIDVFLLYRFLERSFRSDECGQPTISRWEMPERIRNRWLPESKYNLQWAEMIFQKSFSAEKKLLSLPRRGRKSIDLSGSFSERSILRPSVRAFSAPRLKSIAAAVRRGP
jgi:hypothetical protein